MLQRSISGGNIMCACTVCVVAVYALTLSLLASEFAYLVYEIVYKLWF
jgi:hypothetical protein